MDVRRLPGAKAEVCDGCCSKAATRPFCGAMLQAALLPTTCSCLTGAANRWCMAPGRAWALLGRAQWLTWIPSACSWDGRGDGGLRRVPGSMPCCCAQRPTGCSIGGLDHSCGDEGGRCCWAESVVSRAGGGGCSCMETGCRGPGACLALAPAAPSPPGLGAGSASSFKSGVPDRSHSAIAAAKSGVADRSRSSAAASSRSGVPASE